MTDSFPLVSEKLMKKHLLANATDAQRRDFYLSYGGIHWPQIDEDLSFEGMFEDHDLNYAAEPEAEYNA